MASFILNPDEPEINVNFKSPRLEAALASTNSIENQGWSKYSKEEAKFYKAIKDLKSSQRKSSIKPKFDPLIADKEKLLFEYRESVIAEYPNTFLAKYITYRDIPFKSEIGQFWSDINMEDESLVHTNVIADRIEKFMITHSGATETGFINCVDLTKAEAEVNSRVLEHALYTMLDGFYKSNKESICLYIYDNYIVDESCGADFTDAMKLRSAGVMNLQIGKIPENMVIASSKGGGSIDLYDIAQSNEYTLIMFWSSWCHKCEQEIPVLKKLYQEYHGKGFEVFGNSMDVVQKDWLAAVAKNGIEWPNGSELMQWNSLSAKNYRVTQTPTLFLLDKDKKIVLKPQRIFEVQNFLRQNLK